MASPRWWNTELHKTSVAFYALLNTFASAGVPCLFIYAGWFMETLRGEPIPQVPPWMILVCAATFVYYVVWLDSRLPAVLKLRELVVEDGDYIFRAQANAAFGGRFGLMIPLLGLARAMMIGLALFGVVFAATFFGEGSGLAWLGLGMVLLAGAGNWLSYSEERLEMNAALDAFAKSHGADDGPLLDVATAIRSRIVVPGRESASDVELALRADGQER